MTKTRKIIHIDMDAFYASVEQRDDSSLQGKPVIVGGAPDSRGVVATCSYEARKYGIHSAMGSSRAYRLCPHAVFITPRFSVYKAVSQQIREIFDRYSGLVEPLSLDEAYLDVTHNSVGEPSATRLAKRIKSDIQQETGLTSSAGVSFNKFLAKVGSDMDKPDGLTVILPKDADEFISNLPIEKFFGVGEKTAQKMKKLGIRTGKDLRETGRDTLIEHFGRNGRFYFDLAMGRDNRPVNTERVRKSIGKETTLAEDIRNRKQMFDILKRLTAEVCALMQKKNKAARTVTLKVKYSDFDQVTRSTTLPYYVSEQDEILPVIPRLLTRTQAGRRKVRLLGITVSNLEDTDELGPQYIQLEFDFMNHVPEWLPV